MIEQKRERYEQGLARFSEICATHAGAVPDATWIFWTRDLLQMEWNFSAESLLAVATREPAPVPPEPAASPPGPASEAPPEPDVEAALRLPVRQCWQRLPLEPLATGHDLAQNTVEHPSFRPALAWLLGGVMTLLSGGIVGWQARARAREQAVSAELRASRTALECAQGLNRVIGELRAHTLHLAHDKETPVALEEALTTVAERMSGLSAVHIEVDLPPDVARQFAPRESLHLVNIAREALSNSVRHGQATRVRIALRRVGDEVEFSVTDNGSGFAPSGAVDGQGLKNIRERARTLGGRCEVSTPAAGGLTLCVRFPAPAAPPCSPTP